jgi:translocation and assembly module TamB
MRGSFETPDVNANLDVRNLRVQDVNVEGVTANVTGRAGNVGFNASLAGLRLPGSEPDMFARAPITARGTIELQTPARTFAVSLSHPLMSVEAQGTAGDVKRTQASISVPRLAPFAERADIDLDGRATLTATIDQMGDDFRIAATGAINATGGEGPLPRLIGGNARVVLSATVNGPDIAISDARLEGAAANAQLSGQLRENDIGLDWTLRLDDLSLITAGLVGDLRAQGQLRGPWQTARLEASAVGNIGTPTIERQQINVSVNAIGFPRSQSGTFSAQGRFDNAPLSLDGEFARVQDGLKATVERGTWKTLDARADVTIPESGDISGNATLRLARLSDIASVVGEPIEGDVQADVVFRLRDGETSADITAQAQAIRYADAAVRNIEATADLTLRDDRSTATIEVRATEFALPDIAVRNTMINGRIDAPFDNPSFALAVNAQGLRATQFVGDAKAEIDGRTDAANIRFEWTPRDDAGNAGQISTTARLDLPRQRVLVSALQAKYRDEIVTLEQPFTLAFGPETTVDRVLLKLADGQVSIAGAIAPRLALRATAQNVSPALLVPFTPELTNEGTFSATAELSGTLANPEGTITVHGRGLRAGRYLAGVMPASLDARALLRGRSASVNAEIGSGTSLKLSVTGDVSLEGNHALDLDVHGQGELSVINALMSVEGRSLQGQMALDVTVGGTAGAPQLSGRATLVKGEFQDVQRGARVREISLTAEGAGEQIRIVQLSGRAGDGTINGTGTIDFSKADIPVSFTITAQNARPLVSDRLVATTDANLRITGAVRGQLLVAGTIDVTRGEITLPESVPPTVVVLDVRRPGAAATNVVAETAASFADIRYDLTISTRGRVFVRGRGIEAELEGTTGIRGSGATPEITGGFELRRGTFTVASRTFVLTTGRVSFDGVSIRNRIDPTLNLAAESSSGGVTAKIAITGYASAPRIELSSTPTMPPDEILARMLFQRAAAQLSPLQLAQLAETAVSLARGGSGFDPLGSLRRRLGLSRLSVGSTGETAGTTVEAGTYVLRNVYIGAKQGLEGGTQAEVQVDLTDRLKVVGTASASPNAAVTQGSKQRETGSSVGLSYEFEY